MHHHLAYLFRLRTNDALFPCEKPPQEEGERCVSPSR